MLLARALYCEVNKALKVEAITNQPRMSGLVCHAKKVTKAEAIVE